MIDRNDGHLARDRRDRREHAVRPPDTLTAQAVDVRGHPVDAEKAAPRPTRQRKLALSRQLLKAL
jgi:hypothetical protein